jgi:hypothetical protein
MKLLHSGYGLLMVLLVFEAQAGCLDHYHEGSGIVFSTVEYDRGPAMRKAISDWQFRVARHDGLLIRGGALTAIGQSTAPST